MTARECAKDLIRFYVLRGDSIHSLWESRLGHAGKEYCAQIGGRIFNHFQTPHETHRDVGRYQIGVYEVAGNECLAVFSLIELYRKIQDEAKHPATEQLELFAEERR